MEDGRRQRGAAGRRRGGGLRPLSDVVPTHDRGRVAWRDLVGGALAEVTALAGVRDGVILVAAANEAARREILARSAALVGAFNLNARRLRAAPVEGLECWVAERFRPHGARSRGVTGGEGAATAATVAPVAPALLAEAREKTDALASRVAPAGREALARIAARIASREGGWDETGSRAGGNRGGSGNRTSGGG